MSSLITVAAACHPVSQDLCFADLVTLAGDGDGFLPFDTGNTERISAAVNATIFDRFSPFLMSAIHQPG